LFCWRHSQVVRPGTANPLPPVRIRLPPPNINHMPVWRNWQTRETQNLVSFGMCRLDPGHWYRKIRLNDVLEVYTTVKASFFGSTIYGVGGKDPLSPFFSIKLENK